MCSWWVSLSAFTRLRRALKCTELTGSGFSFVSSLMLCHVLHIFLPSTGSLEITWQEIMVGVESGLLMFPINILIITIFRSIKPRIVSKSQKDDEGHTRPPAITIPSILKVCSAVLLSDWFCAFYQPHHWPCEHRDTFSDQFMLYLKCSAWLWLLCNVYSANWYLLCIPPRIQKR